MRNMFSRVIKFLARNVGDVVTMDKDTCHRRK